MPWMLKELRRTVDWRSALATRDRDWRTRARRISFGSTERASIVRHGPTLARARRVKEGEVPDGGGPEEGD
eukprot:9686582-Heterocapsa_arctica.AAC.1